MRRWTRSALVQVMACRLSGAKPAMASQINGVSIVGSGADQRKHQSPASLAFVMEIHRSPVNSLHKGPVARKMFPFDDVTISVKRFTNTMIACISSDTWRTLLGAGTGKWNPAELWCRKKQERMKKTTRLQQWWEWSMDCVHGSLNKGTGRLQKVWNNMRPSWHGTAFRITDPLWGNPLVAGGPHRVLMRSFDVIVVVRLHHLFVQNG